MDIYIVRHGQTDSNLSKVFNTQAEDGIVQDHLITQFGCPVGDVLHLGVLGDEPLNVLLNFFLGNDMALQVSLKATVSKAHDVSLLAVK